MKILTWKSVISFALGVVTTVMLSLFFCGVTRVEVNRELTYLIPLSDRESVFAQVVEGGKANGKIESKPQQTASVTKPCLSRHHQQNIVCIKVHKAASSTTAAILERYGWRNNLTMAVGEDTKLGPHILSTDGKFQRQMVHQYQRMYNLLANHVRYNRAEMDIVVPNATYLTIIRHPVKHFESAFSYFNTWRAVNVTGPTAGDPIDVFMKNPERYWNNKFHFWFQLKSGQIFDLGLDHVNHTGEMVAKTIQDLDTEFDLIMIADYFDESLLLLKQHLCLNFRDILYIPDNFRAAKRKLHIPDDIRDKIKVWNWADMALYDHFNRTFWRKVADYGSNFSGDLQYFRSRLKDIRTQCTEDRIKKKAGDGHGVLGFVMRENATNLCKDLLFGDVEYTKMFRDRQSRTLYNLPKNL